MTSILTNTSSMVALQTLKGINTNLNQIQNEISTGKSVSSAKDNAAVWAISKVMESDVLGFQAISDSLSLGESTVAVARNASETITDLLNQMKEKIVGAQEENVDRGKLQADIDALSDQIVSITGAAQFNGLNLLSGQDDVRILSSLDRASDGSVKAAHISVARQDMTFDAGVYGTGASLAGNVTATDGAGALNDVAGTAFNNTANTMSVQLANAVVTGEQFNLQIAGMTVSYTAVTGDDADAVGVGLVNAINAAGIEGITASGTDADITIASTSRFSDVTVNASTNSAAGTFELFQGNAGSTTGAVSSGSASISARASSVEFSNNAGATNTAAVREGDGYRITIGNQNFDYVAGKNETMEDVAKGLKVAIDAAGVANLTTNVKQDATTTNWILQVDNDGTTDMAFSASGAAGGTATGGLAGVDSIDVTTDEGVEAALANIETFIDRSISAAAEFGSVQGRMETQADFISKLTDSLKAGIGSMVDADMEEASARLQALQVQQQLGIQALSIANQAPQSVLSLFR